MQPLKSCACERFYLANRVVPRVKALPRRVFAGASRATLLTAQILRSKTPACRILTATALSIGEVIPPA